RAPLARNPATGEDLIRVLAADPDDDVRRSLVHHPRLPLDILTRLAPGIRAAPTPLPRVAHASPAEAEEPAGSPLPALRMPPGRRRDLPPAIRDALAADPDAKVAASVAPHPGLTEARLHAMVARHGDQVAAAVAANPDAPATLLEA